MGKDKLRKFAENETFPNMFQPKFDDIEEKGFHLKGKWRQEFFKNDNPITLELGCGKGEYTFGLARENEQGNYIGFDIKGARMWKGCKAANELGMKNIAFVRTQIRNLSLFFEKDEVDEIWVTFPDPQPRESKSNKRLTSPYFLAEYAKVLKPEAIINLKTDNPPFYHFTMDVIKEFEHELLFSSEDIYATGIDEPVTRIQTYYEKMWLEEGRIIHYLRFRLKRND